MQQEEEQHNHIHWDLLKVVVVVVSTSSSMDGFAVLPQPAGCSFVRSDSIHLCV